MRGRHVVIWPDNDAAGAFYATEAAKKASAAGALAVSIITPPPNCSIGFDTADALQDRFDETQVVPQCSAHSIHPEG
jgi:DNA primase